EKRLAAITLLAEALRDTARALSNQVVVNITGNTISNTDCSISIGLLEEVGSTTIESKQDDE
ncbi:MAG: hypothetical protein ABIJ08_05880, partial [Nanoarchaeota archaeon]